MKKNLIFILGAATLLSACGTAPAPDMQVETIVNETGSESSGEGKEEALFDYEAFPFKTEDSAEYTLSANMTAKLSGFDQMSDFDKTNCFVIKMNEKDIDISVGFDGNETDTDTETNRILQAIRVEENRICITREGTYVLEGTLSNGQICVDAPDTDKVQIVLNNADIHCSDSAPLYIVNADKALITIPEGTENRLTDGALYSEDIKGCVFSTCDLTINGSGNLTVEGSYNNGISCKDDLKIVGGNLNITAVNNGLKGNDSIAFYGGNVVVTAGGDGIKTDSENEGKGYLYFSGGSITITADDDALQAVSAIIVKDATVSARCYDTLVNCEGTLDGTEKITQIK